jgi:site-specific DNA-methyltransferase (adenine-specific)
MLSINNLYQGDCLEVMKEIDDKSIDMILCDLPYGTTACKWDIIIPFEFLWQYYKRIIKDRGVIVLTSSQPFTSKLVMSNINMFKYELIWDKKRGFEPQLANIRPQKSHENICIFYKNRVTYNPQKTPLAKIDRRVGRGRCNNRKDGTGQNILSSKTMGIKEYRDRFPLSISFFSNSYQCNKLHPTQKPVALFEYLIKTYTNENDLVLDNCAGSGTTAIAAINTKRNYILIEKEQNYCDIIKKRIENHMNNIKEIL